LRLTNDGNLEIERLQLHKQIKPLRLKNSKFKFTLSGGEGLIDVSMVSGRWCPSVQGQWGAGRSVHVLVFVFSNLDMIVLQVQLEF